VVTEDYDFVGHLTLDSSNHIVDLGLVDFCVANKIDLNVIRGRTDIILYTTILQATVIPALIIDIGRRKAVPIQCSKNRDGVGIGNGYTWYSWYITI
jgi:hypothetical protein